MIRCRMEYTLAAFKQLFKIIKQLRAPGGCPWDREQTPDSLKANLLEEAYECVDAITSGSQKDICEELGDMYLLTTMLSYMKEQEGTFTLSDVLNGINEKLVRRHPHVFSESNAETSEEVINQWNEIKKQEKGIKTPTSIMEKVSRTLPPLERALLIQKKAAGVGFDWKKHEDVLAKIHEELGELTEALDTNHGNDIEEEVGDLLFSVVNIARYLEINPMIALHSTNQKFLKRFAAIEQEARKSDRTIEELDLEEMDVIWEKNKK